ncbi:MAG: hypothetical protein V3R98_07580 [Alphaproteobacteria bacterium]
MSVGALVLGAMFAVLAALAAARRDDTLRRGMERAAEQFAKLVPRMLCALIAAGFVAQLIPSAFIARFLGADAGLTAILVAAGAGMIVPAGPVIAFSIAAVFARSGASVPALIAFITAWTLFAAHRIFIYEIPLLGLSFLRLRALSVVVLPLLAGLIATAAGWLATGVAAP